MLLAVSLKRPTGGGHGRDDGAEGGINPIDVDQACLVASVPMEQSKSLRLFFRGHRISAPQMPGDGVGKSFKATRCPPSWCLAAERVSFLESTEEFRSTQHPFVVISGMEGGYAAGGGEKTTDTVREEFALGRTNLAIRAPSAGSINGHQACADFLAAPVGQFLHAACFPAGQEVPALQSHGMKTFAAAAYINADHAVRRFKPGHRKTD